MDDMYEARDLLRKLIENASSGLFYIYAGIEALVNQLIPEDMIYEQKEKKDYMIKIDIKAKITSLLEAASLPNFQKTNKACYDDLIRFSRIRNKSIHPKFVQKNVVIEVYEDYLNLECDRLIHAALTFHNKYYSRKIKPI